MRKIYNIIWVICLLVLAACQAEDDASMGKIGYLSLDVTANKSTNTKAGGEAAYDGKQLAVQILDEKGTVVKETDDYTAWEGEKFPLPPGKYTVKVSSNGFDGKAAAFDKPYYAGSAQAEVVLGKEATAKVVCTLANVLVTVEFDEKFKKSFKSAVIVVADSTDQLGTRLTFTKGTNEAAKAYFPVPEKSFIVSTSVINQKGISNSKKDTIRDVKARDHVRLLYKVTDSQGYTKIDIDLDGTIKVYTFTIGVPLVAKTGLSASANAWSFFAYLKGRVLSKTDVMDPKKFALEYKYVYDANWKTALDLQAGENDTYSATTERLTPKTKYQYRFVYKDTEEVASEIQEFTTEDAPQLYNGEFDQWYERANDNLLNTKTWFPCSQSYYENGGFFWDTSNPGTTTGAGMWANINPTQGNSKIVHTEGGKSAQLQSQYKVKFAAASLYTGSFGGLIGTSGAKINFGQPSTTRPTALHGWFRYTPANVNYVGENLPADAVVKKGQPDVCAIYIAMTKKQYVVDNTNMAETAIQFETDPNVIAYGELPVSECVNTNGQWKEFTIPLKYKSLTERPTHIIIVCSASKYGDYFTGGEGSLMYVDDFSLIYDSEPIVWK